MPGTGLGLVPTRASVSRFSSLERVTASSTGICRPSLQGAGWLSVTRGRRNPPAPPWQHPLSAQHTAGTARCFSTPSSRLSHLLHLRATPSPDPRGRGATPAGADGAATRVCAHAEGTRRSLAEHTPPTRLPRSHGILPCHMPTSGRWHRNCHSSRSWSLLAITATVQPESKGRMARESRILRREEVEALAKTTL